MKYHRILYNSLLLHVREEYDSRARKMTEESEKAVRDEIEYLESSLELHRQRTEREHADDKNVSKATNHRFSADELDELAQCYTSSLYSRRFAESARPVLVRRDSDNRLGMWDNWRTDKG